jgi:hypothetical protein
MRRIRAAVLPLLVGLALSSPSQTAAGPPDRPLGKMVLDEVADGLRRYRKETDPEKRIEWLEKLAPTRDPRVGVALGEYMADAPSGWVAAGDLLERYFLPRPVNVTTSQEWVLEVSLWWQKNKADLRRRAKQLPQ